MREEEELEERRIEEERLAGVKARAKEDESRRAIEEARVRRVQLEQLRLVALEEAEGTVVEVQGLVEGTSAEDVKVRSFSSRTLSSTARCS